MDIDWALLARYLAGTCTSEEREEFERWLAEAPEHRAVLQGARAMVAQARHEVPAGRATELLASLRRDIEAMETGDGRPPALRVVRGTGRPAVPLTFPLSVRRHRWSGWGKAAAAVLVLASGAGVWAIRSSRIPIPIPVHRPDAAVAYHDVTAARGQRVTFQLADGSAVVLAPGSRLRVPRDYGLHDRTVTLLGEATFTVIHDAARPFAVQTAHGIARDLGTRFLVQAYDGDTSTVVVVAEGRVALSARQARAGSETPLTGGQLGRIGTSATVAVQSVADLELYFSWTEGRLVFRDVSLGEAATRLARWYNIDVRLGSETLADRRLNASAQDEPAGDVLRMIAVSLGLELETSQAGRVYTLRAPSTTNPPLNGETR